MARIIFRFRSTYDNQAPHQTFTPLGDSVKLVNGIFDVANPAVAERIKDFAKADGAEILTFVGEIDLDKEALELAQAAAAAAKADAENLAAAQVAAAKALAAASVSK